MSKGTYLLFMTFSDIFDVSVGSLGTLTLVPGEYCYVGSAMNGLGQRIRRHMVRDKKMRWHIDRLTARTDEKEAYVSDVPIPECILAETAERSGCVPVHKGFGCSDCKCPTHLFRVTERAKRELLKITHVTPFS